LLGLLLAKRGADVLVLEGQEYFHRGVVPAALTLIATKHI
jgi:hypothetical protein